MFLLLIWVDSRYLEIQKTQKQSIRYYIIDFNYIHEIINYRRYQVDRHSVYIMTHLCCKWKIYKCWLLNQVHHTLPYITHHTLLYITHHTLDPLCATHHTLDPLYGTHCALIISLITLPCATHHTIDPLYVTHCMLLIFLIIFPYATHHTLSSQTPLYHLIITNSLKSLITHMYIHPHFSHYLHIFSIPLRGWLANS